MNDKIIVKIIVPELDSTYDVFLPPNEIIWKISKMITKIVFDLSEIKVNLRSNYILINKNSGKIYNNNEIIIDTDIRNGTELILTPLK